jgi:hypothetical protein
VFKTWREYFHFSYLNESTLDPDKTYIFVEFPHGVFPMSELIAGGWEERATVDAVMGGLLNSCVRKRPCRTGTGGGLQRPCPRREEGHADSWRADGVVVLTGALAEPTRTT